MWRPVPFTGAPPCERFCHVGAVYKSSFFIFGGYDGNNRLNDFLEFPLSVEHDLPVLPLSTLLSDLRGLVNSEIMSDIIFIGTYLLLL